MSFDLDLDAIARQERELQYSAFDFDAAWLLGNRLRTMAMEHACPVVIDVRRFGQPLFFTALPGSTPDNVEWVRRKSNVVARFLRSSYAMGLTLIRDTTTLTDRYGVAAADYASHGGSFPLTVTSVGVIGSVTVSGLPQREDHSLVVEALCAELGRDFASLALPRSA
jgi:uncharacterized protein (UPF0303 family)